MMHPLWLKETSTLYGLGLILASMIGIYFNLIPSDTALGLIGAGLPLILPNNSPLYAVLKEYFPKLIAYLKRKNFSTLKEINQMTDITLNQTPHTNNLQTQETLLKSNIETIFSNIRHEGLSAKQEAHLQILEKFLAASGTEIVMLLNKKFNMDDIVTGINQISSGFEQIEKGVKNITQGFKEKTSP